MKQETDEKKFLLVLNEKEGTMRVAAYPDSDKPDKVKTVDPKTNPEEFMTFSGKDMMDEFIENYRRQNNYPQGLKWLNAPFAFMDKIGNALFRVKEGDSKALDEFKQYETKPYYNRVFNEKDIPLGKLKNAGYSEEYLNNPGTKYVLQHGEPLPPVKLKIKSDIGTIDAYVSPRMVRNPVTGRPKLKFEQVHDKKILQQPYCGLKFSTEQQNKLWKEKHLGEIVKIKDPKTGEQIDALISLHPYTNQPYHADIRHLNIPQSIKGQGIDKDLIAQGGKIRLENYPSASGKPLSPVVRYDAFMKKLTFDFDSYRIPKKIGGVELTKKMQTDYAAGKRVDLGEPKTSDGRPMKPIIKMDEDGKMKRDSRTSKEAAIYESKEKKRDAKTLSGEVRDRTVVKSTKIRR
jgi:predicted GNAT family acetyltransferase